MSLKRTVLLAAVAWLALISALHAALNLKLRWFSGRNAAEEQGKFRVGFIPVTCHLTCPVTDFINKSATGDNFFEPVRFTAFPN